MTQPQPWERLPNESDLMYGRFLVYRDLGPTRSLAAAREALTAAGDPIGVGRLSTISSTYQWVARARAFDGRPPPPPKPFRLAADRDPWERQPDESDRMYARFAVYLELGRSRTLTQAAEILTSTGDTDGLRGVYIRELSAKFLWSQRVGAYDREQERLERERLIEARRDMIKRHRKVANDLSALAHKGLAKLRAEKLTALDVVRLFKLAAGIEANALGMPNETVAVTGPGGGSVLVDDLSHLTDEDRRARQAELAREILGRAGTALDDPDAEDE